MSAGLGMAPARPRSAMDWAGRLLVAPHCCNTATRSAFHAIDDIATTAPSWRSSPSSSNSDHSSTIFSSTIR